MPDQKRPFDLSKLNFEAIRLKKRRRMFVYSSSIIVIVMVIAIKLIMINMMFGFGMQDYKKGSYDSSARWFSNLLFVNTVEPYKAGFAKGTAELKATNHLKATSDLESALKLGVPKDQECQVRVNLTLAWVGLGDKQLEAKKFDAAIISYDKAKAVVDGRDCGIKNNTSNPSNETKQANKKLSDIRKAAGDKQNAAKQARNGDPAATNDKANESTKRDESPPSEDQQKKLEDQQKSNARKLNRDRNSTRGSTPSNADRYGQSNW